MRRTRCAEWCRYLLLSERGFRRLVRQGPATGIACERQKRHMLVRWFIQFEKGAPRNASNRYSGESIRETSDRIAPAGRACYRGRCELLMRPLVGFVIMQCNA